MKRIIPFILSIVIPLFSFSQVDSVSYGPGYSNQVFYSFANGEVMSSNNDSWDIAFGTGGFDMDIRINDGFGAKLYLYPNGDTAAWNNIDTNGLQTWRPRYNSDSSWSITAFSGPNISHPDYGWGIYNSTTHEVVGDSIYIIELTDGTIKKLKIDVMATNGVLTFSYADLNGSNAVQGSINKTLYNTKKHVYYSIKSDSIMDLEPVRGSWDIVFTKYQQWQPQGVYYPVTGILTAGGLTVAEARDEDVTQAQWFGQDYTENIGTIGSDWKSFNMNTFTYDITNDLSYFITDTNDVVWQIYFTSFEGSTTGKTVFNVNRMGTLSIEKSNLYANTISIFPNPAINNVTLAIESQEPTNNVNITIYSISGQVVYSQVVNIIDDFNLSIPVSKWNKGVFLVRIGNDANAVIKKLIIQ